MAGLVPEIVNAVSRVTNAKVRFATRAPQKAPAAGGAAASDSNQRRRRNYGDEIDLARTAERAALVLDTHELNEQESMDEQERGFVDGQAHYVEAAPEATAYGPDAKARRPMGRKTSGLLDVII